MYVEIIIEETGFYPSMTTKRYDLIHQEDNSRLKGKTPQFWQSDSTFPDLHSYPVK